jgi:hypothetical protein
MRGSKLLVPDSGGPQGLAGTAFDLVARAQIARDLQKAGVKYYEQIKTASRIEFHLELAPRHPEHEARIRDGVRSACLEAIEYAAGRGDVRRLVEQAQYYALAEMAYRSNVIPNVEFTPTQMVSDELLRMLELFGPATRYASCGLCILNPEFVASKWVRGADADLVVDGALVDLKTTKIASVAADMLRQLAGYAALQTMGGIETEDGPYTRPFEKVELYFARYGATATWTIRDLFPNDGFERFCAVVGEVVDANRKQIDELMERIARSREEESEQKKLARAKARKKRKRKIQKKRP